MWLLSFVDGEAGMIVTEYVETNDPIRFIQPKQYDFVPLDDMTPVEAAWIAHLFVFVGNKWGISADIHFKWELVKRHFVEVGE